MESALGGVDPMCFYGRCRGRPEPRFKCQFLNGPQKAGGRRPKAVRCPALCEHASVSLAKTNVILSQFVLHLPGGEKAAGPLPDGTQKRGNMFGAGTGEYCEGD